ncbi:hypothetical protein Tco_1355548 [Tanacetum coccineum]
MPRTLIPMRPNLGVLQIGIKSQDTVMSDSDESGVTHTEIPSPFEGLSDIGSPGVVRPKNEGLPWMLDDPYVQVALQAQPSPDYIPGLEEPQSPPLPDFFLEDDNKDLEEDSIDYLADGGDDSDDEDESSEDDEDDDVNIEADDEEDEEDHLAPADSTVVALPAADQAPSAEEIELFKTDESAATPPPHPAYRVTARISIPALVPTPVWSDAEVARLLAISTSPSSPLSPWSSLLPHIPSLPLPQIPSPPLPAASTSHSLPLPLPIILSHTIPDVPSLGTPPLHLLSTDHRKDRPEVTLPPRKRVDYGFVATMDREIMSDLERDVGYGITNSWDEIVEAMQGTPVVIDMAELSQRMPEFETRVRRDTDEVYTRLDDEQSGRQLLAGRLNMLFRDRRAHARTARLIETKARMSREAWG